MKRSLASLVVICFILWIMPLGYFIEQAQQKIACDGQRAMCMCYMMGNKSSDKAMEAGVSLKAGSSTNKENSSSGGGNYFVSARPILALNLRSASVFENHLLFYSSPFLALLDQVPKI